jgi:hypothetical protein
MKRRRYANSNVQHKRKQWPKPLSSDAPPMNRSIDQTCQIFEK